MNAKPRVRAGRKAPVDASSGDLEHVDPTTLAPWAKNPRQNDHAVDAVARSIERFGFGSPVVARPSDRRVLAGHTRLKAALKLGLAAVPVRWLELADGEADAFALADNRLGELAEWDDAGLAAVLAALRAEDVDVAELGWSDAEVEALLAGAEDGSRTVGHDSKFAGPNGGDFVVVPGELWRLGRHVLACGDAKDATFVARALAAAGRAGERPLLVTDPPYCSGSSQEAGKAAGTWGDIASDSLSTRGYVALIHETFLAAKPRAAYVFTDWRMWVALYDQTEAAGLPVRNLLVWDKGSPGLGGIWRPQHELILYADREKQRRVKGQAGLANVLRFPRSGNANHYTEKPVDLLAALIENDGRHVARPDAVVLDPFAGSGSTLLAAERLGRTAVGIEVEPAFAAVVLRRWSDAGGVAPERVA